ncbi:mediator of RNA polymerase II transcription subunit 12-like [Bolinopsis microptera]|uniref:mediator of RNA polymerase II transcription subunit 12-like n=1 Tax=Bolinopsis microptera TaxID=2820187 RepID=UPI003079F63C
MASEADILQARNLNKRTKLGPPDVYPQVKDQREDKLNDLSLKKGFSNPPVTQNECGSARERIKAKGLSTLQQSIQLSSEKLAAQKHNNNTVNDNGTRKIQTIQRDQFWSVNPRSNRQTIKKFFGDLSSSSKSLSSLVKSRIPSFQKKEEILDHMAEYQVPVMRAIWFMKITAVYVSSISKKRNTCVALEWTKCISEYLKDNLAKFAEHNVEYGKISTVNTGNKAVQEANSAKNRWNYTLRLCHCMYQDGLLDRQEFLLFIIKWVHELKVTEKEDILKHLVQVMLTYLDDVVGNFVLSRSAAYMCVNKLNSLSEVNSVRSVFDWDSAVKECHVPAKSDCPYHDALLLVFSTVLQRITLMCPTALVFQRAWQSPLSVIESGAVSGAVLGAVSGAVVEKESPLDHLPCYPASLPFPKSLTEPQVEQFRSEIQDSTEDVRARSVISEERWIMGEDTNQAPSVIPMLTTLDEHNFYTAQQG